MNERQDLFITAVRSERFIQDALWGGPEHDRAHPAFTWTEILTKRLTSLAGVMPVDHDERLAKYRRLLIELAAVSCAAFEYLETI